MSSDPAICLRQLIQSLSLSTGISHTLLVFSHDVWDEEINSLVRYNGLLGHGDTNTGLDLSGPLTSLRQSRSSTLSLFKHIQTPFQENLLKTVQEI
jgi:hypothetical protein